MMVAVSLNKNSFSLVPKHHEDRDAPEFACNQSKAKSSGSTMQIYIKISIGNTIAIGVGYSGTFDGVKPLIEDKESIYIDQRRQLDEERAILVCRTAKDCALFT